MARTRRPGLQLVRGLFLALMTGLNFVALQYLQLAETGAIQFFVPILVALFAAPLLKERLDGPRWFAIALGFAGVLVILRPGMQGFHPALLLALLNAALYALFNLLTRHLAAYDPPEATQFISGLVATAAAAPFAIAVWQAPSSWTLWAVAAGIGLAGGIGHYCLALAHRHAPASVLAPFLYQQILWMAVFGFAFFGDVPEAAVIAGGALVVASGAFLIYREYRGAR
jgi:drug/metabolite transporter (DMT)-like permease